MTCCQEQGSNLIRVIDNGLGTDVTAKSHSGFETQQAVSLAQQLRGNFDKIIILQRGQFVNSLGQRICGYGDFQIKYRSSKDP